MGELRRSDWIGKVQECLLVSLWLAQWRLWWWARENQRESSVRGDRQARQAGGMEIMSSVWIFWIWGSPQKVMRCTELALKRQAFGFHEHMPELEPLEWQWLQGYECGRREEGAGPPRMPPHSNGRERGMGQQRRLRPGNRQKIDDGKCLGFKQGHSSLQQVALMFSKDINDLYHFSFHFACWLWIVGSKIMIIGAFIVSFPCVNHCIWFLTWLTIFNHHTHVRYWMLQHHCPF